MLLKDAYESTFSFGAGQQVLVDLIRQYDILTPLDYNPDSPTAALHLARGEGRREVVLYILSQLGDDPLRFLSQLNLSEEILPHDRPSPVAGDFDPLGGTDND